MNKRRKVKKELNVLEKVSETIKLLYKINVSMDIDGVIADTATLAINKLNNTYSLEHTKEDLVHYWAMVDLLKKADPSLKDPKNFAINNIWNGEEVFFKAKPESGALYISRLSYRLLGCDHINYRITSRPADTKNMTLNWFKKYFPKVDPSTIQIQKGPDNNGTRHKIDTIFKKEINIHFDDSIEEAKIIVEETKANVVLIPQPWNIDIANPYPDRIIVLPKLQRYSKMVRAYMSIYDRMVAQSY